MFLRRLAPQRRVFVARLSTAQRPTTLSSRCPQCGAPLPTPLPACPACAFIAPVHPDEPYHALFGLPDTPNPFSVDHALLKRRFRDAQRICHPDAWAGKDQHKQDLSSALSTHVNHAYQSLLHPYLRAEYLLSRAGVPLKETDQLDDPELIMDIMDAREAIENASSDDEDHVRDIGRRNHEQIGETCKTIEELVVAEDWPAVKTATVRLKYLQSIESAIEKWPNLGADDH